MMELDAAGRAATRDATPRAIASPDQANHRRWDRLGRALGFVDIDRAEVLRVAPRALERLRLDRDLRAAAFLPRLIADLANGQRDGVLRASAGLAFIAALAECGLAQREHERVVVETAAVFVAHRGARLPQPRERLRRQVERDPAGSHVGARRIARQVSRRTTCDELLDLSNVLVSNRGEPRMLGLRGRDSRELARGGEREITIRHRGLDHRKVTERLRDPQSLGRRAWRIPDDAFEVIERRHHPEVTPDLILKRLAHPTNFLCVERGPPPRNPDERIVNLSPLTSLHDYSIARGYSSSCVTRCCTIEPADDSRRVLLAGRAPARFQAHSR